MLIFFNVLLSDKTDTHPLKKNEIKANAIDIQENYLYLKQKDGPCFILSSINKNSLEKR